MLTKEELKYLTADDLNAIRELNCTESLIISAFLSQENHVIISLDNRYADYILNKLTTANYVYRQIPKNCDGKSVRELYEIQLYA